MRRILAVVASLDDPSARFRLGPYTERFAAKGVSLEPAAWPDDRPGRRSLLASAAEYESVVLLRRLLSPGDVRRLRRTARRLVYEFDDAMPFRDSARGASPSWSRGRKFRHALDAADAIVAGNDYLASLVKPRVVSVVPTVVSGFRKVQGRGPDETAIEASREARPVVGWLGTAANFPYLESIAGPLAAAGTQASFDLAIMAERPPEIDGVSFDFHQWSIVGEAGFLQRLDVGIMPLFDDAWCRGKCGLKALQYMAAGRPVIASAVDGPGDVVGEGGVLCASDEAWRHALVDLIADPARRHSLGERGRARVERHYAPDVWTDRLLALYLGEEPPPPGVEVEGTTR